MEQTSFEVNSLEDLEKTANWLAERLQNRALLLLRGELGTGKTALMKKILKIHGLSERKVKSPTFSLINKYETAKFRFYHLDLYRLEKPDLFLLEEMKELLQEQQVIVAVEWPEKMDLQSLTDYSTRIFEIKIDFLQKDLRKVDVCVKNTENKLNS